ncbi:uncharacterized protein MELLADRAFT_55770 [Melampsora larici-populina 98AG31]|uniref:Uncharacterized protein n=1 Tax=Melampsora larici-populina (strain 98AG31 / pathotype 3-4-7) TaxID=747676 RepID=F4RI90_MELLP|nr:uncharacterized protein MELLADRAFT_55770 [Melampsora larici-populina 98AG31]EGG08006.1 hypothetical protein MELLADRAFT_55770 [Melampsora larici-populina 98AG31]
MSLPNGYHSFPMSYPTPSLSYHIINAMNHLSAFTCNLHLLMSVSEPLLRNHVSASCWPLTPNASRRKPTKRSAKWRSQRLKNTVGSFDSALRPSAASFLPSCTPPSIPHDTRPNPAITPPSPVFSTRPQSAMQSLTPPASPQSLDVCSQSAPPSPILTGRGRPTVITSSFIQALDLADYAAYSFDQSQSVKGS